MLSTATCEGASTILPPYSTVFYNIERLEYRDLRRRSQSVQDGKECPAGDILNEISQTLFSPVVTEKDRPLIYWPIAAYWLVRVWSTASLGFGCLLG